MSKHLNRGLAVGLALGLGLLTLPSRAMAEPETDARIQERILEKLEQAKLDRQAEVEVEVSEGRVRLTGIATTLHASREIERRALQVSKGVANEIRVMPEEDRSPRDISEDVQSAILRYPYYGVFDSVELAVADSGAVRLQGSVQSGRRRNDIEKRVAKVVGVRAIQNEIRVQSVSGFDSRLRWEAARAIYGDSRFSHYATWSNPPIRIVVEQGRITLTGVVSSPVEQAVVGHIARGLMSFGVENRVEVEGERDVEPGARTRS
jgi:osmotically-inducible protein OsmY